MYKPQRTALSIALAGVINAGALSTQALAQSTSDENKFLEEVIVTAQKREQSANDIGMAITAVNGSVLEKLGITDTAELAEIVPGFTFADTGFTVPVYTIRGVGFNEQSVQATSTVGVYNDQIAVPFPIMSAGLQLDVQRTEVLKGPQGTLFGRNSTGGAINYIANRAGDEFEALVGIDYGRFDTLDLSGVISAPLSETVGARLALRTVQSSEGWQESVSTDNNLGEQDRLAGRLILDIAPSDSLDIALTFGYWEDNSDTQAPQFWRDDFQRPTRTFLTQNFTDTTPDENGISYARVPLFGTDDNQAADWTQGNNRLNRPQADMNNTSISAAISFDINDDITLTSLTGFNSFENNSSYDNSGWGGRPLDFVFEDTTTPRSTISALVRDTYDEFDTLGSIGYTNEAEIDAFSQELRLSGSSGILTWIGGVYYSEDEVVSNTPQLVEFNTSTNLTVTGLQAVENPTEQDAQSWSVFGHTEWSLTEALNLTAGLRYTEDEKDFSGCTADTGEGDLASFSNRGAEGPFFAGGCVMFFDSAPQTEPFQGELDEDSLSWRLGLDFDLTEDVLLYASYSRGFKSGSFPTLTANRWESLFPVVQEQLDAFEIGTKARLNDGRVQVNASAFYYDYKDKQLFSKVITEFGAANSLANVPESNVSGAEFDILFAPVEGLVLNFGATYVQTEVKEFVGYSQVGIEGDFSGSDFPLTPELQAFALANYDFSLSDSLSGFVNFNVSYSSKSYSDYAIAEVLDSGANGSRYAALLDRFGVQPGDSMDVQDVFELPSTTIVGARVGFGAADDSWTVSVWGRNLTDEYIVNNSRKSSDAILAYTGMPRTYGISLNLNF
jgi:outer membrane receptor protein involved in Fe transport